MRAVPATAPTARDGGGGGGGSSRRRCDRREGGGERGREREKVLGGRCHCSMIDASRGPKRAQKLLFSILAFLLEE